ncbi:MAG: DNA polymerase III subunit epsilon [Actinomycetaceae bacterium]|nr:DNA polymerase III subunit epsilon [Actinomycetaceae bacterium]
MTTSWTNLPVMGFDTETTGRNPLQARLVTCSLVIENASGDVEKYYWLANPEVDIPEEASAIHGISTQYARENGHDIVEVLTEISDLIFSFLSQGYPVVAYNAGYDLTLLESELARHNLPTLRERLGRDISPVIDPYFLDRWGDKYRKGSSGKRKLADLVDLYGCTTSDNFHNAEEDVLATLRLLKAMTVSERLTREIERIYGIPGGLGAMSLEELHNAAAEAHHGLVTFLRKKMPGHVTESDTWPIYE